MNKYFLLLIGCAILVFNGCANDLSPEVTEREAAGHSPDAMSHVNSAPTGQPLVGAGGY